MRSSCCTLPSTITIFASTHFLIAPPELKTPDPITVSDPSVVSVIPGGQGVGEMESNLAAATAEVPAALWQDLKSAGLMRADAPVAGAA